MGVFANALNPLNNRAMGIENAVVARTAMLLFTIRLSNDFMDMSIHRSRIEAHINSNEKNIKWTKFCVI